MPYTKKRTPVLVNSEQQRLLAEQWRGGGYRSTTPDIFREETGQDPIKRNWDPFGNQARQAQRAMIAGGKEAAPESRPGPRLAGSAAGAQDVMAVLPAAGKLGQEALPEVGSGFAVAFPRTNAALERGGEQVRNARGFTETVGQTIRGTADVAGSLLSDVGGSMVGAVTPVANIARVATTGQPVQNTEPALENWQVANPQFANTRAALRGDNWAGQRVARTDTDIPTVSVANPVASPGFARITEQQPDGTWRSREMRGGAAGVKEPTAEEQQASQAYWTGVRNDVTADINRRALLKAAFNPGNRSIDESGQVNTGIQESALAGLANMGEQSQVAATNARVARPQAQPALDPYKEREAALEESRFAWDQRQAVQKEQQAGQEQINALIPETSFPAVMRNLALNSGELSPQETTAMLAYVEGRLAMTDRGEIKKPTDQAAAAAKYRAEWLAQRGGQ